MRVVIFAVIFISAITFLSINLFKLFSYLKVAKKDVRWDNFGARFRHMFSVAIGQKKILREQSAGFIHAAIFWGFLVLMFSAAEGIIQGFFPSFSWSFLGIFQGIISFSTDIFSIWILIAVISAFTRRFITKVPRLQADSDENKDAIIVLSTIFLIVLSLFIMNAAHVNLYPDEKWSWKAFATLISGLFSVDSARIIYEICWWVHIIAILGFMNYLPFSKHFHVYTSIFNVFFSPEKIPAKMDKIDFEAKNVEKFGVVDIEDLSWKNIFDSYTCTHCGRCDSACPANQTGKVLSPRQIIIQTRTRTVEKAPILLDLMKNPGKQLTDKENEIINKKFIGEFQDIEALWQCTTCGACMQECPVTIEHVPAIIGMRRSLVMMESNFPSLLQNTFANLENNATPWAFPASERGAWADGLSIPTAEENPDFDVLFWVGCAGSFDDRAKKISVALAKLMQTAGINFSILGNEEQCTGDVARRTGNEYLADMLFKTNVETLNRYNVKKIVTFCPHCLNTLKNEYPDFGGNYEVLHHTQFLKELVADKKLKLKPIDSEKLEIAYHDSCYLGRYNGEYDTPRDILNGLPGISVKEVARSKDRGFCCGAGGGQMFMEETQGKRVNIERTEELLSADTATIAVNCPFCMTMITDGVKAKEKNEEVSVRDIAEILLDKIEID